MKTERNSKKEIQKRNEKDVESTSKCKIIIFFCRTRILVF